MSRVGVVAVAVLAVAAGLVALREWTWRQVKRAIENGPGANDVPWPS